MLLDCPSGPLPVDPFLPSHNNNQSFLSSFLLLQLKSNSKSVVYLKDTMINPFMFHLFQMIEHLWVFWQPFQKKKFDVQFQHKIYILILLKTSDQYKSK